MHEKKWNKPMLIVLVRRDTQESVLLACKGDSSGPGGNDQSCSYSQDPQRPDQCNQSCSESGTS